MENYPAVNIFCELWPFGTYDPNRRSLIICSPVYLSVTIVALKLSLKPFE